MAVEGTPVNGWAAAVSSLIALSLGACTQPPSPAVATRTDTGAPVGPSAGQTRQRSVPPEGRRWQGINDVVVAVPET